MGKILKTNKAKENLYGYLFILPVMLGVCFFVFYPLVYSFISTFKNWSGLRPLPDAPWVQFDIYKRVFTDKTFWESFVNTLITLIGMPVGLILSMGLALLLNRGLRGTNVFRVIFYIPVVCSLAAIVVLWRELMALSGPVNDILHAFGIPRLNWLGEPGGAMTALIVMCVWKGLGASTLLYIAGLSGVPSSCIEAAKLDGAGSWRIFWKITFPLLTPTHFYMLVTGVINGMQIYLEPILLNNGGPSGYSRTLVLYLFELFGP
ncbi:MAG: sugar ABC transporter permease, partial [Clostridiales bacterium]|nr:sugar ABC transporter permease [Clostridiales bacterium]